MHKALALIDRIPEKYRYLIRAQQARFEKGFEASIAILKEMERYYPDDEQMRYNIGWWSYWTGQYPVAAEYLEKFPQQDPNHQLALQRLTETYEQLGLHKKMNAIAKRYVAAVRSPQSYAMLAVSFMHLKEDDAAIQTLEQARQFLPDDHSMVYLLADFYMLQEKYEKAEAALRTLMEASQPAEAQRSGHASFAILNLYRGKYREVLRYSDERIQATWQTKDTSWAAIQHFEKANLFIWGWNDIKRTAAEVKKPLALKDKIISPFFRMRVAGFYVFTGEYALADSIGRLISKTPSLEWFHPYIIAVSQSLKQECDKAQLVANYPILRGGYRHLRIFLLYLLAKCQFEKGEFDQAVESLRPIRTIYANYMGYRAVFYPKSFYLLGRIYDSKGDRKLAIENYEKLVNLWKDADQDLPELMDAKVRLAKLR
jgi:tetratricopeptide (TPR) repeat protein